MNYSVFSTSLRNDSLGVYDARSHYGNMQKKAPSRRSLSIRYIESTGE